jgi:hypothetical protein
VGHEPEAQAATVENGRSSLVEATKLVEAEGGRWVLRLFPEAAEAGGTFRGVVVKRDRGRGCQGETEDPQRSAEEAVRRAGTSIRRYAAANRLNRLGTLTYASACRDEVRLRMDVRSFFRTLRDDLGEPLPYIWVPEWHPGGHGLHVHFAVGRYIRHSLIKRSWGRGHVHIKLLGDVPIGQGSLGEARQAARYLAKYLRKDLDAPRTLGLHRYECAQGFQPRVEQIVARSSPAALEEASERMGSWPNILWRSRDADRWYGPPAIWAAWDP